MARDPGRATPTLASTLATIIAVTLAATACTDTNSDTAAPQALPPSSGSHSGPPEQYVALGSSYAAGPGGSVLTDAPCGRSKDNYPNKVAELLGMRLVDVTCSGATTEDILHRAQPNAASAPQIEAITADTTLITVTIGGNNIAYIPRVMAQSCLTAGPFEPGGHCNPHPSPRPPDSAYAELNQSLDNMLVEIEQRAPKARVVFVDYPPLAQHGDEPCSEMPLTREQLALTLDVLDNVTEAISEAATEAGAHLVRASHAGRGHGVCTADPWLYGWEAPAPYHERPAGKVAIAHLVAELVERNE
ncbi:MULTISPECIES: SGNH/GDSL hydrolase family protein [Gordonia]|uniref:SGNH/GDSL hydrolase family protein n=1 Tax=Gordonia TaxID=2053 RepID=UPI001FD0E0DC|nr:MULTISPECIES: SGNH/GDSL hydrolase family protein [Gordonia]WLP89136.1 SGNH/GDSL hydrolase family protein [Gordonia sp. NB41Y]